MALYVLKEEDWAELQTLTEALHSGRQKIYEKWSKLAEEMGFIAETATPVDEDKRTINAEPKPNPEYIKQKQILLVTDAVRRLSPEDRKLVAELAEIEPKIPISTQLMLVQEGADAKDAVQAEEQEVTDYEPKATMDLMDAQLSEGETPN